MPPTRHPAFLSFPLKHVRGFTIVELLVVMFIIALLMGLLIPAVTLVKDKAKQAKAREQLGQIEAALKIYKDVNGMYPEKNMSPLTTALANNPELVIALESVDREHYTIGTPLIDPWKNPIRYRPAKALPYTPNSPTLLDSDNPPGGDSYQLWSVGKNGRDDWSQTPTSDPKKIGDDLVTGK